MPKGNPQGYMPNGGQGPGNARIPQVRGPQGNNQFQAPTPVPQGLPFQGDFPAAPPPFQVDQSRQWPPMPPMPATPPQLPPQAAPQAQQALGAAFDGRTALDGPAGGQAPVTRPPPWLHPNVQTLFQERVARGANPDQVAMELQAMMNRGAGSQR